MISLVSEATCQQGADLRLEPWLPDGRNREPNLCSSWERVRHARSPASGQPCWLGNSGVAIRNEVTLTGTQSGAPLGGFPPSCEAGLYLCPGPSPACFSDYLLDTGESPWRHFPCPSQLQGTPFYCHHRQAQDSYRVTSERAGVPQSRWLDRGPRSAAGEPRSGGESGFRRRRNASQRGEGLKSGGDPGALKFREGVPAHGEEGAPGSGGKPPGLSLQGSFWVSRFRPLVEHLGNTTGEVKPGGLFYSERLLRGGLDVRWGSLISMCSLETTTSLTPILVKPRRNWVGSWLTPRGHRKGQS